MATNRDLLKEAIAEAKAVKEMAIANAKDALEEVFTPQLKAVFASKLQEMEEEDDYMEEDKYSMPEAEDMMEEKDLEELNLDEILAELEGSDDEDEKMVKEADEDESDEDETEAEMDMDSESEEETLDLEDMSEEDLKAFIEDVIADMVEAGELEAGDEMEGEEMEDEGEMEASEEEEEINIDELLAEIDSMGEEMKIDADEMSERSKEEMDSMEENTLDEVSNYKEIEEIFFFGKKGAGGTSFVKDFIKMNEDAIEAASGDKDASEKLIIKFYNQNRRKMDGSALRSDISVLRKELGMKELGGGSRRTTAMEAQLNEALETVKILRSDLNEVNLLNAKLLYTNKIFKGKNLTESQKTRVLETIDKAKTVSEVKLVHETLSHGINTSRKPISENLGSASKAMGTTKKPIIEANDAFARMRELAFYSQKH